MAFVNCKLYSIYRHFMYTLIRLLTIYVEPVSYNVTEGDNVSVYCTPLII